MSRAKDISDVGHGIENARATLRLIEVALYEGAHAVNIDDVKAAIRLLDDYLDDASTTAFDLAECEQTQREVQQ